MSRLIALFIAFAAFPVAAQTPDPPPPTTPSRFQLVGFTTAIFDGDEGVLGFTLACQSEFDSQFPDSRMCSSVEVLETTTVPSGLSGTAWVRPSFKPAGSGGGRLALDASGVERGSPSESSKELTCNGWKTTTELGLTTSPTGGFEELLCTLEHSVACCAPVP